MVWLVLPRMEPPNLKLCVLMKCSPTCIALGHRREMLSHTGSVVRKGCVLPIAMLVLMHMHTSRALRSPAVEKPV